VWALAALQSNTSAFQKEKRLKLTSKTLTDFQDIKNLLVVVAMDVELAAIERHIQSKQKISLHSQLGLEVLEVQRGTRKIYIAKAGVGTVNAGILAALASEKLEFDALLLFGVGGSLSPDLQIGDVVISTGILQHDAVYSGSTREFMAPGELFLTIPEQERKPSLMAAHPILISFLSKVSEQKGLRARAGVILSGSEFAATSERKIELANLHDNSLIVEMEAAGLAQVCQKLDIPFAAAKTVADRLNPDGDVSTDYRTFVSSASENAAQFFQAILNELGKSQR
jgi:adenosylhomocysteine nucleosidase